MTENKNRLMLAALVCLLSFAASAGEERPHKEDACASECESQCDGDADKCNSAAGRDKSKVQACDTKYEECLKECRTKCD
jgi:hypothetical protein